jgi:hypothetical protein
VAATVTAILPVACGGSSVEGTYSDPNGSMMVELKSGAKAAFTLMNQVMECTYKSTDKEITLDCPSGGAPMTLTRHDDGSLSGPPGGSMPILKKTK